MTTSPLASAAARRSIDATSPVSIDVRTASVMSVGIRPSSIVAFGP